MPILITWAVQLEWPMLLTLHRLSLYILMITRSGVHKVGRPYLVCISTQGLNRRSI